MIGQKVATLLDEEHQPGYYEVYFDASHFASGMYMYRIVAGNFVAAKKKLLVK